MIFFDFYSTETAESRLDAYIWNFPGKISSFYQDLLKFPSTINVSSKTWLGTDPTKIEDVTFSIKLHHFSCSKKSINSTLLSQIHFDLWGSNWKYIFLHLYVFHDRALNNFNLSQFHFSSSRFHSLIMKKFQGDGTEFCQCFIVLIKMQLITMFEWHRWGREIAVFPVNLLGDDV